MRFKFRSLWIFGLPLATGLAPAAGEAAGLGEAVLRSGINQPLRLEIPLLGEDAAALDASCFRLQSSGSDDLPWLTDAQLRIEHASRLVVTTRRSISHPVMMIGITAGCGAALHREYPLLFSPAEDRASDEPAVPVTPPRTAARPLPPAELSPAPRESRRLRPSARLETRRPTARAAAPEPRPAPPPAATTQDRLSVRSAPEGTLRLELELGSHASAPQTGADPRERVDELSAQVDEKIGRQIQLDEKIRQLEAVSRHLEAENRRLQGLIDKPAPEPRSDYLSLPWLLLYGIAALGAGAFLWRQRRRDEYTDIPVEPALDAEMEAAGQTEQEQELELEPDTLSAADIWPDQTPPVVAAAPLPQQGVEDWNLPPMGDLGPSSLINIDDSIEEHDSAVELAEIMMSFGRIQGAAETLAEYIRQNPKQAVRPWVKLLEVYKAADLRAEFDALALKLNQTFNVIAVNWDEFDRIKQIDDTVEQMPHIMQALLRTWRTREAQSYLFKLLRDNRDGTRRGFPLGIVDDLLMLSGVLEIELGVFRPSEQELAELAAPLTETPAPAPKEILPPPDKGLDFPLDLDFEQADTLPMLPEAPDTPAQSPTTTLVEFNLDDEIPPPKR